MGGIFEKPDPQAPAAWLGSISVPDVDAAAATGQGRRASATGLVTLEERLEMAPSALIADDKQIVALSIRWVRARKRAIALRLEAETA